MRKKTLESLCRMRSLIISILRSLIESTQKWSGKSKLKCLRKFICRYCPFVMDEPEIMTGISENWRVFLIKNVIME